MSVAVQSMVGLAALPLQLTGPVPLLLVAAHLVLTLAVTSHSLYNAFKDAVWSQR